MWVFWRYPLLMVIVLTIVVFGVRIAIPGDRETDLPVWLGVLLIAAAMTISFSALYLWHFRPTQLAAAAIRAAVERRGYAKGDKPTCKEYAKFLKGTFVCQTMLFWVNEVWTRVVDQHQIAWGTYTGSGDTMDSGVFFVVLTGVELPITGLLKALPDPDPNSSFDESFSFEEDGPSPSDFPDELQSVLLPLRGCAIEFGHDVIVIEELTNFSGLAKDGTRTLDLLDHVENVAAVASRVS